MHKNRLFIGLLAVGCGSDASTRPCDLDLECQSDEGCSPGEDCHPLYCRCLPFVPNDAGVESEAEAEAEPCGDGICADDEFCADCPADCCPDCGDGACGAGEDDETCAADCGCQATDACACGIAPFGCFCGPGCLAFGICCPDADACGVDAELGTLTEGCGNGSCDPTETCAICPEDCGLCGDGCPPLPLIISYEIGDDQPAREIVIQVRFISKSGPGKWQPVASARNTVRVALAIPVPSDAVAVDVWVHYVQANKRGRASCKGMELFIPVGVLQVRRINILLVGSFAPGGAGDPGDCAHRYALK